MSGQPAFSSFAPGFQRLSRVIWALFFLSLPVTSFPYFPAGLGGKTLVRPLAIYPVLLLSLLVVPRLFKRPLPKTFLPLLAFCVAALASSALAFVSPVETLRGVTLFDRFVRNAVTLAIGLSFFATTVLLQRDWKDLDFSLRWLYAGFAIALAWGTLQAVYVIAYHPTYFSWMNRLQSLVSIRKLFATRISGMTYEPKWFAEQITFVLIPWLLGAVLSGRSIFQIRLKWITVEMLLLAWAVGVLVFTFSRTGLLILVMLGFLSFLIYQFHLRPRRKQLLASAMAHDSPPSVATAEEKVAQKRVSKRRWRLIFETVVFICGLLALFIFVGSQNPYVSRFWRYFTEARQRNRSYLEFIAVQQRYVYWVTAYRTFTTHPWLGVGLGNYAFYFDEMLPEEQIRSQEIIRQTTPVEGRDRLITPKNLLARLLAETGILGTAAFLSFVMAVAGCALFLWFSPTPLQQSWGMSALLGMAIFAVVIFSFDSFAIPNMWVVFGLITAAAHLPDPDLHAVKPEVTISQPGPGANEVG